MRIAVTLAPEVKDAAIAIKRETRPDTLLQILMYGRAPDIPGIPEYAEDIIKVAVMERLLDGSIEFRPSVSSPDAAIPAITRYAILPALEQMTGSSVRNAMHFFVIRSPLNLYLENSPAVEADLVRRFVEHPAFAEVSDRSMAAYFNNRLIPRKDPDVVQLLHPRRYDIPIAEDDAIFAAILASGNAAALLKAYVRGGSADDPPNPSRAAMQNARENLRIPGYRVIVNNNASMEPLASIGRDFRFSMEWLGDSFSDIFSTDFTILLAAENGDIDGYASINGRREIVYIQAPSSAIEVMIRSSLDSLR